ncbi:melanocyte-stimulating hormone receptor-like [Oculina patagonica]
MLVTNLPETEYSGKMGNNSCPETIVIINCALNTPLMLISIIGNTLVLAAILRTPSLRSPSITFLCSLAVSDLLVGLLVQPIYIANELTNDLLYNIRNATAFFACAVSLCTITAISVDRFLALHYHMRYPNLMTTRRAVYISATLWVISFLLSFLTFWNTSAYGFAGAVSIVICLLITTVCYIRIYRIVRQHQIQIHVQQQAVDSINAENNQNMQQSKKSAINTFIYYIVMVLCYTPLIILMTMLGLPNIHLTTSWIFADTVAFMNSAINPFLYCWRFRELRTAVLNAAREMLCRETPEN